MMPICKCGREALGSAQSHEMPVRDLTNDLHIGIIICNLMYIVVSTSVNILVGELVQDV